MTSSARVIHEGQPLARRGPSVEDARAVCVLLHGRGRDAEDVLALAERIGDPDVAFLAPAAADEQLVAGVVPRAAGRQRAVAVSALGVVEALMHSLDDPTRGWCWAASRRAPAWRPSTRCAIPARYGGLLLYTGGFIGPPGTIPPRLGSFDGTPAYLGTSATPTAGCRRSGCARRAVALRTLGAT